MALRTDDLHKPFLDALHAIGRPAELHEIARWINENAPIERGPVKNDGTLGRTRNDLEEAELIERDVTGRRYRPIGLKRQEPDAATVQSPASRKGKAGILTYHDPAVLQQLKLLSAEKGTTQQKLTAEALNMVFAKYGKGQIA